MLKTFLSWDDRQLPDGTVIWSAPTGHVYVTTPGCALPFPVLMTPTGEVHHHQLPASRQCGDRSAMMPKRRHTRAQNHANYVAAERRRNRIKREARQAALTGGPAPPGIDPNDEPPPF
ncbi:hypothetical protein C1Y40_00469 [Mycobacterium talmoniae]|uniref:13e12 repeat-containing protein n=1 Tax=Mycobacterium talmoniae TaxID=1858794 RepID=A0A2S8BRP5_9MYCO|nr:hypothetical protein [Mycobacterium eburneum]PQM49301.1 hypothetical protein C1Y40_00469 [Mycobacterium talmoniae]TDH55006.1 hypothetical protein E2F47_10545 [Mycobacterium eburneum]